MRSSRAFGLCLLVLATVSGCATLSLIKRPTVVAVRPQTTHVDFHETHLSVTIHVHNPYPFPIQVVPIQVAVAVKENRILREKSSAEFPILPKQTGTVIIPIKLYHSNYAGLGRELATAARVDYRIYGSLRITGPDKPLEIIFTHRDEFPVLQPPTFSIIKVQLEDVTLSKARVIADAEADNPNVFAIDITDISFNLNMGNAYVAELKPNNTAIAASEKKRISLIGNISAESGLIHVLMNGVSGQPEISASGAIRTPYGKVKL